MWISVEQLQNAGACAKQTRKFKREWGDEARVTLKNCQRAIELELDCPWLACQLFSPVVYRRWCTEWAERSAHFRKDEKRLGSKAAGKRFWSAHARGFWEAAKMQDAQGKKKGKQRHAG